MTKASAVCLTLSLLLVPYAKSASMSQMPAEVQQALVALCHPCQFSDSDQPWNSGDVGTPGRQLVAITHTFSKWIIQYELGGFVMSSHTVVFEMTPSIHLAEGSSCLPSQTPRCDW